MSEYLDRATDALAAAAGADPATIALSDDDARTLLEIARVAAHASERINAPLVCYLAGRLAGQASLDDIKRAVEALS